MTTKQLVTIIVLITSFIIILFLLFRLNLGETSDKEICHNSVTLKAKTSIFSGYLDCKINYLCVSGGGNCEGIPETSTADINGGSDVDKVKDEIMKALADEIASCWWQFGEGKIDYADRTGGNDVACSVCSITGFDENLKDTKITYLDFYDYLQKTSKEKGGSQTYLKYIYDEDNLGFLGTDFPIENYLENEIDASKTYFILTGMSSGVAFSRWGSEHLPVIILEKTQDNHDKVGCDEFLTKP